MRLGLVRCGAAIAVGATFATSAIAETFSLRYRATPGCPSDDALVAEVLTRTSDASRAATQGRFQFTVLLSSAANRDITGTLTIRSPSGRTSKREFAGPRCDEVVSAMALVIALAVDPRARLEPIEQLRPSVTAETFPDVAADDSAGETQTGVKSALLVTTPQQTQSAGNVDQPWQARSVVASMPNAPRSNATDGSKVQLTARQFARRLPHWQMGLGAHGAWLSALAPGGGMLLAGIHLDWRSRLGPVVLLGADYGPRIRRRYDTDVDVDSRYIGGEVDLGWQLPLNHAWSIDTLVSINAGANTVRGVVGGRISTEERSTAFFCAVGPGVRLRYASMVGAWALAAQMPWALVIPTLQLESAQRASDQIYSMSRFGVGFMLSGTLSILESPRAFFSSRL